MSKNLFSFVLQLAMPVVFLALMSCNSGSESAQDVATKGEISLEADESFAPLINAEEYTFESLYPQAKLNISYKPEGQLIRSFLNGEIETIIIGRPLNPEEVNFIKSKGYSVQQTKIAMDAIALAANKAFPDSSISLAHLSSILNGKVKYWNEINTTFSKEKIRIVFDKSSSSNLLYIQYYLGTTKDSTAIFAAGSFSKVIDYVKSNPYSIGVIGWSWISDEEDATARQYAADVKILAIADKQGKSFVPSVEAVIDSLYPLTRGIYAINKGARVGLGTGFASFMASDRGQRIVLKAGLVPATVPGREIELK